MSNVLCIFCGWTYEQAYEELDRIYKLDPDSEYVIYDVWCDHDMSCEEKLKWEEENIHLNLR
jgi:hypothetical protein